MGESDQERKYWIAPDAGKMHCFMVKLALPSLRLLSLEESEYRDGLKVARAIYRFDMDGTVRPFELPDKVDR